MKTIFTTLAIVLAMVTGFSQGQKPHQKKKDQIQAQKVAFLSRELALTKEEAEKFWPVYNEYESKMDAIHKAQRKTVKKLKEYDELTEEEAYSESEELLNYDIQRAELRKEYLVKFSELLGKKKGAKVYYAEHKFKRELLKKIKKDHNNGNPPPPPPGH